METKAEQARKKAQGQKRKLGGITHHCGRCDYSAARPCRVRAHEARMHKGWDKLVFCNCCAYKTPNEDDLLKHISAMHRVDVEAYKAEIQRYNCAFCDHREAKRGSLVEHERAHLGVRKYACGICTFRASEEEEIGKHIRRLHRSVEPPARGASAGAGAAEPAGGGESSAV